MVSLRCSLHGTCGPRLHRATCAAESVPLADRPKLPSTLTGSLEDGLAFLTQHSGPAAACILKACRCYVLVSGYQAGRQFC